MRFICEDGCGFEADYDEDETEVLDCPECGGSMYADTSNELE